MAKTWFETQLSQALSAGRKRDYRKAVTILENLAARGYAENGDRASGGHPELYLYLARSYHALGNFARAVAYARLYLELRPDDGSGWFFLGRTYLASVPFTAQCLRCAPVWRRIQNLLTPAPCWVWRISRQRSR